MARRTLDSRPTVRSEGGLLPPELLDRITDPREKDLPGLDPSRDYGLESNVRLTEAAARSWEHAKAYWGAFKARLESSRPGAELGITRQQWLVPLLAELGYDDLDYRQQAEEVNGRPFHVSHRATSEPAAPPLHLVAANQPLDKADPSAPGPKASPHGFLQSYLNETDHLWGIVSNGRQLRILRDNASLTRPAYLEFDLEGMMEGGVFADFTLLWLVAHRSRLPKGTSDTDSCFLEQWYKAALVRGARALGDLRLGVEGAIRALGQGFLDHPENEALRAKLAAGDLDDVGYYRQLLRVVYRLLFLLVAEERDLLFPRDREEEPQAQKDVRARGRAIYNEHYSVSRLRERLRLDRGDDRHDDLWRAERVAFDLLRAGSANLGLPALGGGIFDTRMCPDLEAGQLRNDAIKAAIRGLSLAPTKSGYRRINYRDLDVEELGSVYESLLDEQPSLRADGTRAQFTLASGGERKTTGSYYTPSVLVQELLRSALDPVIQQALASAPDIPGKRAALLDLAVCDPACGSGHFLLGAARRIGRELARLASGEHEPDPAVLRHSIREAITHCVYGVDLNPLAVDLCRLALWLEGHEPGRPLGFLDHHIKCGNSLVGATAELIEKGIPTEAFERVEGDSKDVAKEVKKQNRQELEKPQLRLFESAGLEPAGPSVAEANEARAIAEFEEDAPEDVLLKEEEYGEFAAKLAHKKRAADLWTAAFFWPLRDESPAPPTQSTLLHHRAGRTQEMGNAFERQLLKVLDEVRPFHWELEFPEVFDERKGGFDCMLGNPPFANAIEAQTQRNAAEKKLFSILFGPVATGAFDQVNLFVAKSVGAARRGGWLGLICPRATASSKGSAPLRDLMHSQAPLRMLWCPDNASLFGGADVFVCLIAAQRGSRSDAVQSSTDPGPQGPAFRTVPLPEDGSYTWWELIADQRLRLEAVAEGIRFGDAFEIFAGCATGAAYELSPLVEDASAGIGPMLITTGAIDRFNFRWGEMTIRYLKRDYRFPRWPASSAPQSVARARDRQLRPKVLVAGLSRVLEAALDLRGETAGVVSTFVVCAPEDSAKLLLRAVAVLNAACVSNSYLTLYGAKQMSGGNCTVGKTELGSLIVPPDITILNDRAGRIRLSDDWPKVLEVATRHDAWEELEKLALEAMAGGTALMDRKVHQIVAALFGLSQDQEEYIYSWWEQRISRSK